MEVKPKQIVFYVTLDEKTPYEIWYKDIADVRLRKAVDKRLERVAVGNYGDCEPVGDGVLELRFQAFGIRIYFVEIGGVIVLLLCAGDKSSQSKDIAKAKEYWLEYCSRVENEEV
jgi:putative addiction module killer protein